MYCVQMINMKIFAHMSRMIGLYFLINIDLRQLRAFLSHLNVLIRQGTNKRSLADLRQQGRSVHCPGYGGVVPLDVFLELSHLSPLSS